MLSLFRIFVQYDPRLITFSNSGTQQPAAPARLIATLPVAMGLSFVKVVVTEAGPELEAVEVEAELESSLDLAVQ